ncbi:MAG: clan AA aspartic protease [Chitinophagaceae bacterium]|jgi:hypothetical protein|nr:MAG: clan AA aspartic protease [Chitinophagaceae bacterium]
MNNIEIPLIITELEKESYHLFFEGVIQNKPVRLLLDTGASKTVLDKSFLEEFLPEVIVESSDDITGGLGASNIKSQYAEIEDFSLQNMPLPNMRTAVLDLSHVNQSYQRIKQPTIQGIIGSDLLKQFNAIIDYGNSKVVFVK